MAKTDNKLRRKQALTSVWLSNEYARRCTMALYGDD